MVRTAKEEYRKKKKRGYLLLEICIAIFLFSVLIFILSIFLRRAVIIEKVKKDSLIHDERIYNSLERIIEDIRNRDREDFFYKGEKGDIFVSEKETVFRKGNMFYKLEIKDGTLFVSDGEKLENTGMKVNIGKYDKIKFQKTGVIFLVELKLGKMEDIKIVNLQ